MSKALYHRGQVRRTEYVPQTKATARACTTGDGSEWYMTVISGYVCLCDKSYHFENVAMSGVARKNCVLHQKFCTTGDRLDEQNMYRKPRLLLELVPKRTVPGGTRWYTVVHRAVSSKNT